MKYWPVIKYLLIVNSFSLNPFSAENEICSHSIHVKSFDGDVRGEDRRVFCVDCMSSCAHRQLGFRNHYPSRTRSPNTASLDLLNKHLITCMNHPHPISYAFICLYKVKFVLLTYYTDQKPQMPTQFLILCAHIRKQDEEWKKNPQAEWAQNGILEWEVGNFSSYSQWI